MVAFVLLLFVSSPSVSVVVSLPRVANPMWAALSILNTPEPTRGKQKKGTQPRETVGIFGRKCLAH